MGGYGSGRWGGHRKKTTVEECLQLDVNHFCRENLLAWGTWRLASRSWKNAGGKVTFSVLCEVDTTDRARPRMRLSYSRRGREVDLDVGLQTTRHNFGGQRWWFTCPLATCGRRVRKLYLPPGALRFGCRHCHSLSYRSCQESDKRVSALRQRFGNDPVALLEARKRGEVASLLALKAVRKMGR